MLRKFTSWRKSLRPLFQARLLLRTRSLDDTNGQFKENRCWQTGFDGRGTTIASERAAGTLVSVLDSCADPWPIFDEHSIAFILFRKMPADCCNL
jgi:hypothetical protein